MSSHHLNNSFIKRFQDKPVHLGITEKRYNDLLIHQFTGDNKDILPLLSPLAGKLNDNEIVQRLMSKLIRKDIPATKCMLCFIQYLQHKLKIMIRKSHIHLVSVPCFRLSLLLSIH